MRLVSCPGCHTQYDVTSVEQATVTCSCGRQIANRPLKAVDATVERCGSCGAAVAPTSAVCGYCQSPIVHSTGDLSLICPECFARNADAARFCTHCGVGFSPQVVTLEGEELDCPACERKLQPRSVGGVALHECPGCNGVWAPGESFDAIVRRAIAARSRHTEYGLGAGDEPTPETRDWRVQYRKCPECGGYMQRKNYGTHSGVIVDWCGEHGTWLDADELGAIAAFIIRGGLERSGPNGPRENGAPLSPAEARATAEAERIMAGAKMAQARRRARAAEGRGVSRSPIVELFEALFGR